MEKEKQPEGRDETMVWINSIVAHVGSDSVCDVWVPAK
jgi:hypothetical protein